MKNIFAEDHSSGKDEPESTTGQKNIYSELGHMADETNRALENRNWVKVQDYLEEIAVLYRKGDYTVQRLIANVYVFALNMDTDREISRQCRSLMPAELKKAYYNMYYNDHP